MRWKCCRTGRSICSCSTVRNPDVSAAGLPEEIKDPAGPPLIVFGKLNGSESEDQWARMAKTRVVRRVESMDRMFDQVALLLHRDPGKLPVHQRRLLEELYQSNKSLAEKCLKTPVPCRAYEPSGNSRK